MKTVEAITTGFIYVSWLASLLFLVAYGVTARWYRTTVGRQLFSFGMLVCLISTLAVAGQIFGQDYAARPVFRLITWTVTALVTVGFCVALYRAQLRKER